MQALKAGEECCDLLSSGHDKATELKLTSAMVTCTSSGSVNVLAGSTNQTQWVIHQRRKH